MANLNKVLLMGNLTRDIDLRFTPRGTAVADITIAINRVWKDDNGNKQEEVTFVDATLWGKQAELAKQYLAKGRGVYLEGRIQLETWDDKDTGKKRSKLKIVGDHLQYLPAGNGPRSSSSPSSTPGTASRPHQQAASPPVDRFEEEDDIPF